MAQIAKWAQSFAYDLDGNVTNDGLWDYQWDAENRLIRLTTDATAALNGFPKRVLEFNYDYLGRRALKRLLQWNAGANNWDMVMERRFLYDGWSLVGEYSVNTTTIAQTLARSYTWGLDIARTLTDAGGVGALVQVTDHASGKSFFPTYDGNGNIASLVNADTGALAAVYEYNPYGEPLRAQTLDPVVDDQPFRFSTKYTDGETGLVYYGNRYYSPSLGRFSNRDPIEEQGGINLYGFCKNNPVNRWDYLGNISQYALGGADEDPRERILPTGSTFSSGATQIGDLSFGPSSGLSGIMDNNSAAQLNAAAARPNITTSSSQEASTSGPNNAPQAATNGNGGSVLGNLASGALDLLGKVWALPNTAIGLVGGMVGWALGGDAPTFSNNAIVFANSPLAPLGAITLGNVILIGSPTADAPNWGPDFILPNGYTVLQHEEQHTYQAQFLGLFYLPANAIGAAISFATAPSGFVDPWHYNNFMENGPLSSPPSPWPAPPPITLPTPMPPPSVTPSPPTNSTPPSIVVPPDDRSIVISPIERVGWRPPISG